MTTWGTLHFLPWMRRGLAGSLASKAVRGAPVTDVAAVDVSVVIGDGSGSGDLEPVTHTIRLRGPGDVVGLVPNQVVRTDPAPGVQDAEYNYFVSAELATADLPWMFTPAAPDRDDRLVPWLALVVVRDDDANRITATSTAPLPVLSLADAADELPNLDEAWAWAHVQSTADLTATTVADAYADAPELFRARLLCPRRLEPDTAYLAAVVPTFEAGRRAGLGLPAAAPDPSTAGWWRAWTPRTTAVDLPVLYSWTFRTGRAGDFENLVRRLKPRELDAGLRDFDIGHHGTPKLPPRPPAAELVSWKGALVSPAAREISRDDTHWDAFGRAMRSVVNEGLGEGGDPDPDEPYDPLVHDPVVGPPAYGALAIGLDSVPEPVDHDETAGQRHEPVWFGQANLDPVHRSIAGLGSEVVRRNQESLLAAAWNQAAALGRINRVLNWSRLAAEIGQRQVESKIVGLSDASLLQVTAPAATRLHLDKNVTAAGRLAATSLPAQLTSAAFQRICRPEGPVGRARRGTGAAEANPATALTAACLDDLTAALGYASFVRPAGLHIAAETLMQGLPVSGNSSTRRARPAARSRARRPDGSALTRRRAASGGVLDGVTVAEMPSSVLTGIPWVVTTGRIVSHSAAVVGQAALAGLADEVRSALQPRVSLSAKLAERVAAPGDPFADGAVPAGLTATPEFPEPLYEKLRAIDPEFLLPGVGAIPDDTVGLTYVNAAFVEAFLLGANEELASEFVWREYPALLSQTWLRTFWDSIGPDATSTVADIGPVAGWNDRPYLPSSVLGDHQVGYGSEGTLVLVIKGELLRRYPDTVIYATKGVWNEARTNANGAPVAANTLREEQVDGAGSPDQRKNPLFVGALDRTTVFLGFDLDAVEALGPVDADGRPKPGGHRGDRDAGWFFVFEEAPDGPRFGLDVGRPGQAGGDVNQRPPFWREASWYHLVEDPDDVAALTHAEATGRMSGSAARPYDEGGSTNGNTFSERWGSDAAAMARITSQRPVRMLVHASAMLPEDAAKPSRRNGGRR